MPAQKYDLIQKALSFLTTIAVALIAYWGNSLAGSVADVNKVAIENATRLTAIESNRYTVGEAKKDQERVSDRLTAIEVREAAYSAKLDAIQRELTTVGQGVTKLVDRDARQQREHP